MIYAKKRENLKICIYIIKQIYFEINVISLAIL